MVAPTQQGRFVGYELKKLSGILLGSLLSIGLMGIFLPLPALATADVPGEEAGLSGTHVTQEDIQNETFSLREIRGIGRLIFSTPLNKLDGYGDGATSTAQPGVAPGGRPTLQGNGTFLRVNGLDAQACVECHFMLSNAYIPFIFGVGGTAGSNANAIFQPTRIEPLRAGKDNFNGRFINPPFVFGSGGVELLAKEMTAALQALQAQARRHPGTVVPLVVKGVEFGTLVCNGHGTCDTSRVEGIDADLVVRPFGRKGEFATVRAFDLEALAFHFGMQAVEVVGDNVDADGDGVTNEITVGDVSALTIFITNLERPRQLQLTRSAQRGKVIFERLGCAECHIPVLTTTSRYLTYSFPEVTTRPRAHVFFRVDLTQAAQFERAPGGGIAVPLYADLKRHDMGPELAESFGSPLDAQFTTARLWGVADTAPYLHDGRAQTLSEAILAHGGEAQTARDAFAGLSEQQRIHLLSFLRSLRTPKATAPDLE